MPFIPAANKAKDIITLCQPKMYVTGRTRRGIPHKVCTFLININRRVDMAKVYSTLFVSLSILIFRSQTV